MMSVVTARSATAARAAARRVEVALGGVAAVHGGEHAIAAGLQRQVQVLAHRRACAAMAVDRVGPEVLRVRAGEAHPTDAVDRRRPPAAARRTAAARRPVVARRSGCEREVAAVGVHVLAEQRDLGDAVGGQALDLGDEVVERAG